jgi:hypothetical protein
VKRSPLSPGAKALSRGSTFKPRDPSKALGSSRPGRRPSFAASAAQRKAVRDRVSIISGQGPCDASHVFPRGLGGCADALCVVPLTRAEHVEYDADRLDLLPFLLAHGLVAELQHALGHANGDLIGLLHIVTGVRWQPAEES